MAASGNTRPQVPTLSLSNPQTPSKAPATAPFDDNASLEGRDTALGPPALRVSIEAVTEALSALSLLSPRLSSQRLFAQVISCEGIEPTSSHDGYYCSLSVEQQIMRTATLEPSRMTRDSESEGEDDPFSDEESSDETALEVRGYDEDDETESIDPELYQVQWSQNFSIDITHPDAVLQVELWARDMTVPHHARSLSAADRELSVSTSPPASRRAMTRLIGYVRIPVNSLPTGQPLERYFRLRKPRFDSSDTPSLKGSSYRGRSRARVKLHLDLNELSNSGVSEKDFIKLKIIGKGSFGTVYQVRHRETKGLFAMKVLHKQQMIEKDAVRHAMAERDVLKSVHHPFLVSLKYAFQTDEFLFMIIDYLNGGELFFHLSEEDEGFGEERTRFYAAELVLAVGYLHDNGIIYRDLKPENVLLTMHGHVCLVDFGLSKTHLDPQVMRTKTFCGSLEYMSPEMLHGEEYGKDIDWWALATMVYEMIDGLPPFWNEDQATMLDQIAACNLDDQPRFGTRFSENCEDFVRSVLVRDPSQRLGAGPKGTAEIQAHPWFEKVDWRALYRREVPAPWLPRVKDEADTRYVDQTFLNEDPETEFQEKMKQHQANVPNIDQQQFSNFSFEEIRSPRAPVTEPKSVSHSRASSRRHSRVGSEKRPRKKHRNKAQKVTGGVSPHASPQTIKKKPRRSNAPSPNLSDDEGHTRRSSRRNLLAPSDQHSPRKKESKGSKTPKTPKSRTRSNSTENGAHQSESGSHNHENCAIS